MTGKKPGFPYKYIFSILFTAAIVGILIYWMDMPKLLQELKKVRLAPVIGACLLNVLVMTSKGIRWYYVSASESSLSIWQSIRLTILSFFVNSFIPARGGDVLKGIAAARENRTSKATSLASVGLDKLMDVLTVFFLALAFPFLPQLPPWLKKGTLATVIFALSLAIIVLIVVVAGRKRDKAESNSKFRRFFEKISAGFGSAVQPKILLLAIALSLASYALQIAMVLLCTRSAGISLSIPEAACALLALNIVVGIPLTPLNMGTLHLAFVAVLVFFGYQKEPAMTAAIALHLAYTLPLFAIGPFLGHKTFLLQTKGQPSAKKDVP
ncbi:MAG: lysylphosphatidylglycerol synthase transmembrane domain-containing protein [Pseudomonadota bacterium]